MILPTKGISVERSLLVIGAEILRLLEASMTVSRLWERLQAGRARGFRESLRYDWFVLALDLLFSLGAIGWHRGQVYKVTP